MLEVRETPACRCCGDKGWEIYRSREIRCCAYCWIVETDEDAEALPEAQAALERARADAQRLRPTPSLPKRFAPDDDEGLCDCGGKGWDIYNGCEIQRCDDCQRYETDEDAEALPEAQLALAASLLHLNAVHLAADGRALCGTKEACCWTPNLADVTCGLCLARMRR